MELEFIDWLTDRLRTSLKTPRQPKEFVELGVGDDAAVLRFETDERLVVATDMVMDGAHFELTACGPAKAGHKALGVNLSDLAAMAAEPLAAFVSLALPRVQAAELARQITEGMLPLAERFGCAIAGGDTNVWDGPVVINVAVIGTMADRRPLTRAGAVPGDWILVTGPLGGSLFGRHLIVVPRIDEAVSLHEQYPIHAAIDVSDGLAQDLARITRASGCGAIVKLDAVPIHEDAVRLAKQATDGLTPLDHALGDGEDFELILAVPPDAGKRILENPPSGLRISSIGEFVADQGLWSMRTDGTRVPLAVTGFEHR